MEGLTFDTGALCALESRNLRMVKVWTAALKDRRPITVPSAVIVEWWREQRGVKRILDSIDVDPLDGHLAFIAGAALAKVGKGPSAVDAIVMASAAQRGDIVYTGDYKHLSMLQSQFPVRVLRV